MSNPFESLTFKNGPAMHNRFMLAPMTNLQSHDDGRVSDEELNWLQMRAEGGFGLVMTCAATPHPAGRGFPGQLGCYSDEHLNGLTQIASQINAQGAVSSLQICHGGMRSPEAINGVQPVSASADEKTNARALTEDEVYQMIQNFVEAAGRADKAGFNGVELHGAHGYLICQFLSPTINRRQDDFGGSQENRARFLRLMIEGIRNTCRPDFQLGVRLSPERFGMRIGEIIELVQQLCAEDQLDFIDMSLWDVFKQPEEEDYKAKKLISWFTDIDRGNTRIGVAGKVASLDDVAACIDQGADFAIVGRAAILHHNLPKLVSENPNWKPASLPVSVAHLNAEGVTEKFVGYLRSWKGFVAD